MSIWPKSLLAFLRDTFRCQRHAAIPNDDNPASFVAYPVPTLAEAVVIIAAVKALEVEDFEEWEREFEVSE